MAATPKLAISTLTNLAISKNLKGIKLHHLIIEGQAEFARPEHKELFRSNSFFTGVPLRKAVQSGLADFTPIFLQDVPLLFRRKILELDAAVVHVTPADKHGYHSLGASVDCTREALINAKLIIGQVNKKVPRTQGDALVHCTHFDALFESDEELSELPPKPLSKEEQEIGRLIATQLVDDGATLQLGIGGIPDAVCEQLANHKDLGVHSEMFSDGIVDLVRTGAITNARKKIETGRFLASFCIGTRKLFDWMDDNPSLAMKTCDYVNRETIICQNPKVTAINACIEIDLIGNVCSDSIGSKQISGFGGQVDFLRAAAMSADGLGRPILAMTSLTNRGESKIVPTLKGGASVTSTRAHAQYIVTEYGIAQLFGKSYRQRAFALIQIAHPSKREELEKAAYERLGVMPSK